MEIKVNESSVEERICSFLSLIINQDLKTDEVMVTEQSAAGNMNDFIRNPLPLDTASNSFVRSKTKQINTLLFRTINNNTADTLMGEISASLAKLGQERSLICVAASSGAGKTHSAYSLGRKCFVSLVRVGSTPDKFSLTGEFTEPWSTLRECLEKLARSSVNEHNLFSRAKKAYILMQMLISCYYFTSVLVIEFGFSQSLPLPKIRELLLRFYRNVVSDLLVADLFKKKMNEFAIKNFIQSNDDCQFDEITAKLKGFFDELRTRKNNVLIKVTDSNERLFVFAFDEVQLLLAEFKGLFIENEEYTKYFEGPNSENANPNSSCPRSLFYGLSCVCQYLLVFEEIGICFMGTSFSITKLDKANHLSVARANMRAIKLNTCFTVDNMIELFSHYYRFKSDYFNSSRGITNTIKTLLGQFKGRPFYFINYCFVHFALEVSDLLNSKRNAVNKSKFVVFLQTSVSRLEQHISSLMSEFFTSCMRDFQGKGSVSLLVPVFLKYGLCGNGKIPLTEQAVHESISQRVIPVSGGLADNAAVVDISTLEPTTFVQMRKYLKDDIRANFEQYMKMLVVSIQEEKGKIAEEVLAYYLCIQSICFHSLSHSRMSLHNLVKPLYPHHDPTDENSFHHCTDSLSQLTVNVDEVVNLKHFKGTLDCEFNVFIDGTTGKYSFSKVVFGFDEYCGIDLALLTTDISGKPRFIAILSKNHSDQGFKASLFTLSPGLQYLQQKERKGLLSGQASKKEYEFSTTNITGIFSKKWYLFQEWAANHSEIMTNWIRVSVIAQIPTMQDYNYVYRDLPTILTSNAEKIEFFKEFSQALKDSPLVLLSYNSTWLKRDTTKLFVAQSGKTIGKPREVFYYFPVSLIDWKRYFILKGGYHQLRDLVKVNEPPVGKEDEEEDEEEVEESETST
jgi:hypothetical protein